MADLDVVELVAWLFVVVTLAAVPLVALNAEGAQRRLGPRTMALLMRAAEHFRPVDEPDPLAEALRAQIRREKLLADVQRLRRILATDEHMSAVRQIGNRMAYGQLLQELEAYRNVPQPGYAFAALSMPASVPAEHWADDLVLASPPPRFGELDGQRPPAVEVLELGPRRRAAR